MLHMLLYTLRAIGRLVIARTTGSDGETCNEMRPAALIGACVFCLVSASAQAQQQQNYNFKSMLPGDGSGWCIDVPEARYVPGAPLAIEGCKGAPNQTFRHDANVGTMIAGGYCVDGLGQDPKQPPSEGDQVVLAECIGGDRQGWAFVAFQSNPEVFSITNNADLCVTIGADDLQNGVPLVLAKCAEAETQGWIRTQINEAPVYGVYKEPVYYWREGHRYCWYPEGWHGAGWY